MRAAGVRLGELAEARYGPVNLETAVRFRQELRPGDEVEIGTEFAYGPGRSGRVRQRLHRRADGVLVAEVSSVTGMLDLDTRRPAADSPGLWRRFAARPEVLGL